ncbi:LCP family protein [Paeniglutamicibacter cryotolerans]|uniref:LCP family protein required for cell wall assembly n=1 Tax=Paeniglutamicibacter cryotolerans TaxID=670079 RepID=A0A839QK20_9MICC|nr:LCP family protein [Paeniglutamicibacter cryotolerans]MBB2995943.1 LCP family protein required for cell wall assembly [Paeniglutamicibacter cryotolerans]
MPVIDLPRPAADPVRHPESASAPTRSKRAIMLLLLTVFLPGGAQIVAGNRALGRKAVTVTLSCWALLVLLLALALINRNILISLFAQSWVQLLVVIVLMALAVGWLLLFLNTLVLIRPKLLAPGMRGIVAGGLVLAIFATSGILGYGAFIVNEGRNAIQSIFARGPAFAPVDGRYNILIMGGDAGSNRQGLRPDSVSLLSVDAKNGHAAMISIPRNFQNTPFPADSPMREVYPAGYSCGNECIFNALYPTVEEKYAHLYPGVKNPAAQATVEAAEGITGLKVQGYVLIDMAGFSGFIDAMGGVTVKSGGWVPYNAKKWPNSTVNTHWFSPGVKEFNGKQALWFARSRDFTTDYHRIRRQQCLQQAMMKQFSPQTVLTRFTQIMDAGEELVETDIPQQQLGSFLSLADKARQTPFKSLTLGAPDFGTASQKFSTYPDFGQIHTRIDELLASTNEPPASKPTAKEGGSAKPKKPGTAAAEKTAPPSTKPDGSPITEEYLVTLEQIGRRDLISELVMNNDQCSVP